MRRRPRPKCCSAASPRPLPAAGSPRQPLRGSLTARPFAAFFPGGAFFAAGFLDLAFLAGSAWPTFFFAVPRAGRPASARSGHRSDRPGARGVAKDRRIGVEDAEMRHGRKSRSVLFDGFKRHVLRDLDTGLVPAVGSQRPTCLRRRSPMTSPPTWTRPDGTYPSCTSTWPTCPRPWSATAARTWRSSARPGGCAHRRPVRQGPVHPRLRRQAADLPRRGNHAVRARQDCPLPQGRLRRAARCGTLHHQQKRAQRVHPSRRGDGGRAAPAPADPEGRAKLRERVAVEHALAHVGHWQGRRARYRGTRKNLFDLCRVAVVHNLHIIARQPVTDSYQLAA